MCLKEVVNLKIKIKDYSVIIMRLNKFLARSGVASRRKADELIKMATTTVNGEVILDPAFDIDLNDTIRYDGKLLRIDHITTILMNKPKGVITSVGDPKGRKTVIDYISNKQRIVPVGRLDKNSTGLLILTNDGDLHYYLTHPRNQIVRVYDVELESLINSKQIKRISKGIDIGYGEIGKVKVLKQKVVKGRNQARLSLRQGKNREIRRIFNKLKIKLFKLHRISFGEFQIGGLKEGQIRVLNHKEISSITSRLKKEKRF